MRLNETSMKGRIKIYSGAIIRASGGFTFEGIPSIAWDNTRGDSPVKVQRLKNQDAWKVYYKYDPRKHEQMYKDRSSYNFGKFRSTK